MALNVTNEPLSYFDRIVPCGDPLARVTSLNAELRAMGREAGGKGPKDKSILHSPENHLFLMRRTEALLLEAFSDTFRCDWSQDPEC